MTQGGRAGGYAPAGPLAGGAEQVADATYADEYGGEYGDAVIRDLRPAAGSYAIPTTARGAS